MYAVALLIPLEAFLNVYRLNRTTGISSDLWRGCTRADCRLYFNRLTPDLSVFLVDYKLNR